MKIELQGFGFFELEDEKYKEFWTLLGLNENVVINIWEIAQLCVPVLCLNFEEIISEGPIQFGHIISEIGKRRFDMLISAEIIRKIDKC